MDSKLSSALAAGKSTLLKPNFLRLKPKSKEPAPDGTLVYLKDDMVRAIGIPLFGLSIPTLTGLFGHFTFRDPQMWLGYVYFVFLAFVIWQGNRYLFFSQRGYYSWFAKPYMKAFLLVFANIYYTAPVTVLMLVFWYMYSGLPEIDWSVIKLVTLANVICVLFVTHLYETVFLIKERENDLLKMERLERTKAQAELEALKSQIDPHFMFNSLNTLSHLIESDAERAGLFNEKLAEVYRYILVNRENNLVFLKEELSFLEDYFKLFKIRFDESVFLEFQLPKQIVEQRLLPPISLQILLENAIKHNSFSKESPLEVFVLVDDNGDYLTFKNRTSPKRNVKKNRLGLANLSERYELLSNQKPIINQTEHHFEVKVPLLKA